jgi:hypothetical protein
MRRNAWDARVEWSLKWSWQGRNWINRRTKLRVTERKRKRRKKEEGGEGTRWVEWVARWMTWQIS